MMIVEINLVALIALCGLVGLGFGLAMSYKKESDMWKDIVMNKRK